VIAPLHLVTDDAILARPGFPAVAREALEVGGERIVLHLRGHGTPAVRLLGLARELLESARRTGAVLLVNDRVDVAAAAEADGVQLGTRSLPVREARRLLPVGAVVGASVHGPGELRGVLEGALPDFFLVGTLFSTPSHPGRPGGGPGTIAALRSLTALPLIGVGGVTTERVAAVLEGGGDGVAVLRGVWDAPSAGGAVRAFLERLGPGPGTPWTEGRRDPGPSPPTRPPSPEER